MVTDKGKKVDIAKFDRQLQQLEEQQGPTRSRGRGDDCNVSIKSPLEP